MRTDVDPGTQVSHQRPGLSLRPAMGRSLEGDAYGRGSSGTSYGVTLPPGSDYGTGKSLVACHLMLVIEVSHFLVKRSTAQYITNWRKGRKNFAEIGNVTESVNDSWSSEREKENVNMHAHVKLEDAIVHFRGVVGTIELLLRKGGQVPYP